MCADRAFPADGDSILSYVVGHDDLLIKNYPEFRHYRDIAFWFKFFLNPDKDAFPEFDRETEQRKMILSFHLDGEPGEINTRYGMYEEEEDGNEISAQPRKRRNRPTPTCRFDSLARPTRYVQPSMIENEDDVLHLWELPDFGVLADQGGSAALGQHDAELLLSYLTVPYLRIPLVISFFANEDRIHSLQSFELQSMLHAVLFELATTYRSSMRAGSQSTYRHLRPSSSRRHTACSSTSCAARLRRSLVAFSAS